MMKSGSWLILAPALSTNYTKRGGFMGQLLSKCSDNRYRLSIEITEEQNKKLAEHIPWGLKKAIFSVMIDMVIEKLELHHGDFLGPFLDGRMELGIKGSKHAKI